MRLKIGSAICVADDWKPSSGAGSDQPDVAVQGPKCELSDDGNFRSNNGYSLLPLCAAVELDTVIHSMQELDLPLNICITIKLTIETRGRKIGALRLILSIRQRLTKSRLSGTRLPCPLSHFWNSAPVRKRHRVSLSLRAVSQSRGCIFRRRLEDRVILP